jgi:hypothetical protein
MMEEGGKIEEEELYDRKEVGKKEEESGQRKGAVRVQLEDIPILREIGLHNAFKTIAGFSATPLR